MPSPSTPYVVLIFSPAASIFSSARCGSGNAQSYTASQIYILPPLFSTRAASENTAPMSSGKRYMRK